jgi:hypothetical protein
MAYDRRMDGSGRGRLRSFALGGLLGAAGAVATLRRVSRGPQRERRIIQGGLAAFEDAPCYLELVGEEAQRYREGGESSTGAS